MKYLLAIALVLSASCKDKGTSFDPNFHLADVGKQQLVDRHDNRVDFNSEKMLKYACMHRDKIAVLRIILQQSQTIKSRSTNSLVGDSLKDLIEQIDGNKKAP